MILYRIAQESRKYKATDLTGAGAARYPGRWNKPGEFVIYAALTRSLAVLETAAHIDIGDLPLNRFVVRIRVPPQVWRARQTLNPESIDPAWSSIPAGKTSEEIGSRWYQSAASLILLVPSVIVQAEQVVLINASHRSARLLRAEVEAPFEFDRLFR